jgi:HEAT repeat protein
MEEMGLVTTCLQIADPGLVPLLADRLDPQQPQIRWQAVEALKKIDTVEAAKALQPHLGEEANLLRKLEIAELLGRPTFIFAMNRESYEKLPDDLKQLIDDNSGPEVAALFGRAMDEVDVIGRAVAQKAGNDLVTLDEAETARWQQTAQKTTADWIAEMNGKGIDGAALVEDARRRIEKYSSQ